MNARVRRRPRWRTRFFLWVVDGMARAMSLAAFVRAARRGPWRVAVDEGSMVPALAPGDWLLVDPTCRRWPRPGSLVVVREPGSGVLVIKRVAARGPAAVAVGEGGVAGGAPVVLGRREAWLLGDAAEVSIDSRRYGAVELEALVARAWFRYGRVLRRVGLLDRRPRWSTPAGSSPTERVDAVGIRGRPVPPRISDMRFMTALRTLHIRRAHPAPPDLRPRVPRDLVAWIADGRSPFDDYSVAGLVPDAFVRYARIFHPALSSDGLPVRWETVAAWSGRSMHRLAQWDFLSIPIDPSRGEPPFDEPPDVGRLRRSVASAIVDVLVRHTTTPDDGFIGVWDGYGGLDEEAMGPDVLDLEQRAFLVRRVPISEAVAIGWTWPFDEYEPYPPTLLWPADRAWFLAGDIDLDSTYVGGTSDLIDDLLARNDLEVQEVFPADGTSVLSDEINGPPRKPAP